VSVIIPCYNQAQFLSDSIESVLRQTHPRYEIIVVDDGSRDHPESIAARYPAVRFIRQNRQGAAAARNTGWRESRGDLLVFLDGDDRLLPNGLSAGYDCFRAHPDCGFVFGHGYLIGPTGEELRPNPLPVVHEAGGYEQLLERNPIAFPGVVMFRRAAFESVDGFKGVVGGCPIDNASDYDLYLRVAERFPIHAHPEMVAEWRQHGTNTSRNSLMMLRTTLAVLNGQRGPITRDSRYRAAKKRGVRRLRVFFGERLIQELRLEVRSGQISWPRFGVSLLALLRHYPTGVAKNALRRLKRTLSRQSRRPGDE
jgi:glycosyltransferase involved in cell wall biosynthesis